VTRCRVIAVGARLLINHPKEIKFEKTLGKVPFPDSIAAAHERLCHLYTSIWCHPLFSELV